MSRRFARRALVASATVLALTASGCGDGGSGDAARSDTGSASPTTSMDRPASTAKLSIVSPTNGQVVHGTTVQLKVSLRGARLVPATSVTIVPDEGHLHVTLDDQLVSMTGSTTQLLSNLASGQHLLKVEFVASDHAPFDPRVIAAVAFEVAS